MCRAMSEGGRRCPCGHGSRRRAYQRARYVIKQAQALEHVPPPDVVAASPPDALPSHTKVSSTYRDPTPTRHAVMESLSKLRTLPSSEWRGSGQMKEYVSSTITHGAVLRDNVVSAADAAWEKEGITDDQVRQLWEDKKRHDATRKEHQAEMDAIIAQEEALKESNPGWQDDTELSSRIRELGNRWATMSDEWSNESVRLGKELFTVNKRRAELFTAAVHDTLAAERPLGGQPLLDSGVRLSKDDMAMCSQVMSKFPTDMIDYANARRIPMTMRRSKRRAHYVSNTRRKKKESRAGVLSASDALRGDRYWHASMNYVSPEPDGTIQDRHVGRMDTVPDTPDNRSVLEERIATWKLDNPRAPKNKTPVITKVSYANADGSEMTRLALYIPEAYSTFTVRNSATTCELTFHDPETVAHEFGHHLEYNNPEIGFACKEFLARRTEGMERITYLKGKTRAKDEMVVPDGFVDCYIGKDYANSTSHTEVFSMGVEGVMTGAHGGLLGIEIDTGRLHSEGVVKRYRSDPEHFALIMGLLSSANRDVSDIKGT